VQRAPAEPSIERAIDRGDAERNRRAAFIRKAGCPFENAELPAQLIDSGFPARRRVHSNGCGHRQPSMCS
jgi:hypothetical protein